jgi:predicted transcriptional regulator
MERIFYAVLALHIAGKPINRENIRALLEVAGTPVDEPALDAMAAFVESLEAARREKERPVDPRIIKFLASELTQRRIRTKHLEALVEELTKSTSALQARETLQEIRTPETDSDRAYRKEAHPENSQSAVEDLAKEPEVTTQRKTRYVYGIAASGKEVRLGPIGLEGSAVYTIPYQELCAIVHSCPAEPYQSNDDEVVKGWVRAHQTVLDEAKVRFGTIIPLGFDTMLKPKNDATSPDQAVQEWLKEDYDRLHTLMEKIEGKDEYGVQVSYEPSVMGKHILEQSEEVKKIKEEMATKSPGMAYIYKQKLEKAMKAETERLADEWFKDFYSRVKNHTDDIVVEKTKKLNKDKVMLLNLSCLVAKEKVDSLGEELEKIRDMEGFSVHFSGPWPPYSFVAKPVVPAKEEMQ